MRYPASEKLEIIRLGEHSHLPIKQTLDKLGISSTMFYRWYDHYQVAGLEALEDQSPRPSRVWNRIPDDVRQRIVDLALDVPELSPRELAVRFTDTENPLSQRLPSIAYSNPLIWLRALHSSSSRPLMNLETRQLPSTSCGKPPSPI